ncbi:MAG: hypothetical protein WCJ64_05680 [Rhodospirillaceae bacterium]
MATESHAEVVARLTAALPPRPDGGREPLRLLSWQVLERCAKDGREVSFQTQLPRVLGRAGVVSADTIPLSLVGLGRGWDWRAAVDAAIAEGQAAAAEISARDLKALLALPPERRKAALDAAGDLRGRNLLPDDRARLRDSFAPARPGSVDPAAQAAARLAEHGRKVAVLMEYVASYEAQLDAARDALAAALGGVFRDGADIADRVLRDLLVGSPEDIYRAVAADKYGAPRWWVSDAAHFAAREALTSAMEIARLRHAARKEIQEIEEHTP